MGSSEHLTTLRRRTPQGEHNLYCIEFVLNTNKINLTLRIYEHRHFLKRSRLQDRDEAPREQRFCAKCAKCWVLLKTS